MSFMAISEFLYTHFVKALKKKIGYKCWELKFILINTNIFLKFARILVFQKVLSDWFLLDTSVAKIIKMFLKSRIFSCTSFFMRSNLTFNINSLTVKCEDWKCIDRRHQKINQIFLKLFIVPNIESPFFLKINELYTQFFLPPPDKSQVVRKYV